jgi:para-nitrobenzyl esterase
VRVFGEVDGISHTEYGLRDRELALWSADTRRDAEGVAEGIEDAGESEMPAAPGTLPVRPLRGTELRAVVRRLRRAGGVGRD